MKYLLFVLLLVTAGMVSVSLTAPQQSAVNYTVDTLATNLVVPWEIVFLPDRTMLFTERSGKLRIYRNNRLIEKPALQLTSIDLTKKMGLLGMVIHPRFEQNKWIYLAYNYRGENYSYLRIARYRFTNDTLVDPFILTDSIPASQNHTGCRLRFGPDQKLYITTGDADRPAWSQDLKSLNGKILRLNDDGSIPADNPFQGNDTARKEIWTYGHRNTQGIVFQPVTGLLYNSEHGPTGGDELNLIRKGINYGWPVIHHQDTREGMETPMREYSPSVGPSQLTFYNGTAFPALKGKLLLACLRGEKIIAFTIDQNKILSEEILLPGGYGRIRALTVGPDGYIYFSTSQVDPPEGKPTPGFDMVLRLRPASGISAARPKTSNTTVVTRQKKNSAANTYSELCAACHGANMEGTDKAKSLTDGIWEKAGDRKTIMKTIREGIINKGMPAWEGALSEKQIAEQADLILSKTKKIK